MDEDKKNNFSLTWLPKKTFEILAIIPWSDIEKAKAQSLVGAGENLEVKGFRKGKAPVNLVKEKLGENKILELTLENLVPAVYSRAIKALGLQPIASPKVELVSAKDGEDWQIKFISCEEPQVNLGNYKDEIAKQKAAGSIWTPGKGSEPDKKDEKDTGKEKDEKIDKAISWLSENIKIEISDILVDSEVNRKLSELLNQIQKLGLTLDQYLGSTGKSVEKLREEYRNQAIKTLNLQLILNAIAETEKIEVNQDEIDKAISSAKNDADKKALESQKYVLASIIRQQKTLDFLANLV